MEKKTYVHKVSAQGIVAAAVLRRLSVVETRAEWSARARNREKPDRRKADAPDYKFPFISSRIRLFISTAYSSGSSFDTGLAKPETIIVRASSSLIPRLIR